MPPTTEPKPPALPVEEALAAFGWEATDVFWDRYHHEPWVYNLANALAALYERQRQ